MIGSAGIDTWKPCWYLDPDGHGAAVMRELATVAADRGRLLPEAVGSYRVGWVQSAGMLYAEGHPDPEGLCRPDRLPAAFAQLVHELREEGIPVPEGTAGEVWDGMHVASTRAGVNWHGADTTRRYGFGGVSRCDATVDLQTDSTAEGLAILAGIHGVAVMAPRCAAQAFHKSGKLETVYFRGYDGVKILGRWYDKGVESGLADRGRWIRPEDQRRFPKGHRRDVSELTGAYVREKFQQRFMPLWQATRGGVTVAGYMVIAEKISQALEAGVITKRQAEQLCGYVVLEQIGNVKGSRVTEWRRKRSLRELGLVVADGCMEEVELDLTELLDALMDGPSWGVG